MSDIDRVSTDELRELSNRMPAVDLRANGATTVDDIAEAVGLEADDVRRHLRQIRSEKAFARAERRHVSPVGLLGVVALGAGCYYLWAAAQPEPVPFPVVSQPYPFPMTASNPQRYATRTIEVVPMAPTYMEGAAAASPPGFSVNVTGQSSNHGAPGYTGRERISYEECRKGLKTSILDLSHKAVQHEERVPHRRQAAYHDIHGNTVHPKVGHLHVSVRGWIEPSNAYLKLPIDASYEKQVDRFVAELLRKPLEAQKDALRLDRKPGVGPVILPPGGFGFELAGRRLTEVESTPLFFLPVDPDVVANRVSLAIQDAMVRDLRPPEGRWTVSAQKEPDVVPKFDRVSIRLNEKVISFDVPTAGTTAQGIGSAAVRAIEKNLEPVRKQVAKRNAESALSAEAFRARREDYME